MSRFGSKYEIGKASGHCGLGDHPINAGETYVAALVEREEDDGFDRVDVCQAEWDEGQRPDRLYSFWRTVMEDQETKERLFVDDDVLVNLFHRLEDDDQPTRMAYRFIIGLILMRKRLLKCDLVEERDGQPVWMMRPKGMPPDSPKIAMIDPGLDETQSREVADQLGDILRGDL